MFSTRTTLVWARFLQDLHAQQPEDPSELKECRTREMDTVRGWFEAATVVDEGPSDSALHAEQ